MILSHTFQGDSGAAGRHLLTCIFLPTNPIYFLSAWTGIVVTVTLRTWRALIMSLWSSGPTGTTTGAGDFSVLPHVSRDWRNKPQSRRSRSKSHLWILLPNVVSCENFFFNHERSKGSLSHYSIIVCSLLLMFLAGSDKITCKMNVKCKPTKAWDICTMSHICTNFFSLREGDLLEQDRGWERGKSPWVPLAGGTGQDAHQT